MVVAFLFRQLLVGYSRHLAVIYTRREQECSFMLILRFKIDRILSPKSVKKDAV